MRIPSGIVLSIMKTAALMSLPLDRLIDDATLLDDFIAAEYISLEQFETLLETMIEASPNKDFHIQFAREFTFAHIEIVETLIVSSELCVDALKDVFSYKELFMPLFDVRVDINDDCDLITYASNDMIPISDKYYYSEMVFVLIVTFGYRLMNFDVMVERLQFRHPKPSYHGVIETLFKCSVSYDGACDRAWVKKGVLQQRFDSSQKVLNESAKEVLVKKLDEEKSKNKMSQQVSNLLLKKLDQPSITIASVASELAMSTRSLQRVLQEESLTFNGLKKEVRLKEAVRLLDGNLCLTTISQKLGFLEVASFSRFFKSNMSVSPGQYRKNKSV